MNSNLKTVIISRSLRFWKRTNVGNFNAVKIGKVTKERYVPDHIPKPSYYFEYTQAGNTLGSPEIKNVQQIRRMRESCKLAANILNSCYSIIGVGITTDEIDSYVHDQIISYGAYPSPLRYVGYPKSVCTSVNNVACHGIPDDRKLLDGDIINIDITVFYNGYHGDCSKTFLIGNVDERGKYLVDSTENCLKGAINLCRPGLAYNNIGKFIDKYAKSKGLTSIPYFIGHGIGSYFHGPPEILHYYNNIPGKMHSGVTFTIEPILSLGGPEVEIQEDGWTAISIDNARNAQFEHTLLVTDAGVEILTIPD